MRRVYDSLPTLLLAAALLTTFAFTISPAHYYSPMEWDTAKNMAIVENLSPEHNFRMFTGFYLGRDGEPEYNMYSRFPIGGFLLLKLVTLPFGDDLTAKVFAGRMFMLAFFIAAAFLAYHALVRIVSNKWIAATATLVSFSSYYVLFYSSWISNEMMGGLFGVMLTFHGIVVFTQERRFRQLALKTSAALLLDWHVYALLIPFAALGICKDLRMRPRGGSRFSLWSFIRESTYLKLGALSLLLGVGLLAFNFISEYDALNGETPLTELPSVQSAVYKTSLDTGGIEFPWGDFLRRQFYRIVGASAPYWLTDWEGVGLERLPGGPPFFLVSIGFLLSAASLIGLRFMRRDRISLASLALAGFIWAALMRTNTYGHLLESIYWVGVPLTLWVLLLLAARRIGCARLIPAAALASALMFTLSAHQMLAKGPDAQPEIDRQQAIISDVANIRDIALGKNIVVAHSYDETLAFHGNYTLDAYFSGSYVYGSYDGEQYNLPNEHYTLITHHRDEEFRLLTPENKFLFLYDQTRPADLRRSWIDSVHKASLDPSAVVSGYRLSVEDRTLIYLKEPCGRRDAAGGIRLHIFPERKDDLPEWSREFGHDSMTFPFFYWGIRHQGACALKAPLPDYPIAGVRTRHFAYGKGRFWEAAFVFNPDEYRAAYATAAFREPDARGAFDLHFDADARTLIYVKEPCAPSDIAEPFFLHIFPERTEDISRPEADYEDAGFDFRLNGAAFDGKCAGFVSLPDYPIVGVRTGQFGDEGELWDAAFAFNSDEHRAAYAAAASREPDARGSFDLHLDADARTLIYVKEPCAPSDIADIFFLHIFPKRAEDIPRLGAAYESKDFDFRLNGAAFEGKCAGLVALPDYPIAGVRTGQVDGDGKLWEAAFPFNPDEYRAAYTAAALREPDVRGVFDLHLDADARTLTYVKEPCGPSDIADPFFLHIFPERTEDIHGPEADYENKDFDFRLNGAAFEGKCAGLVPLPDYPIAGFRTGQFGGEGELWDAALVFNPDEYRAAYAAAASREPDARGAFDLHFDADARTLTYVKEPCAPPDVEHPFFLHVTPSRERDLPRESRQLGFEARDFDFRFRGAVFDGKCAAQAFLPEYAISRIRTGQWIRGEGETWEATVEPRP